MVIRNGYVKVSDIVASLKSLSDLTDVRSGVTSLVTSLETRKSNVTLMATRANNANTWLPLDALFAAVQEVEDPLSAMSKAKKMMILALNDADESYHMRFMQAGMCMSECVVLCDVAKTTFMRKLVE